MDAVLVLAAASALAQFSRDDLAVGESPSVVAILHLNQDGFLDVVVANEGDHDLTIFHGDGRGGLERLEARVPAGRSPTDVAPGDFDGDGHLDVALANHETDYLTLLLGDGRGGLAPAPGGPLEVESRPHPHGVAAADFDGDGHLDLAVESWEVDRLEVMFGDGSGHFSKPALRVPTGRRPYWKVRAADVNGDGRADLVTTNSSGESVSVLLSGEGRSFEPAPGSPFPVAPFPFFAAVGDLNGDDRLDIAVAHYSGSTSDPEHDGLSVLLGDGRGRFAALSGSPFATGSAPVWVGVGDVDGDGTNDVATANLGSDDVSFFFGSPTGVRPGGESLSVGEQPLSIALGDLDRDGRADVVTAGSAADSITVVLSR